MNQGPASTPPRRVALFVTYTMTRPIVGGAFFRALRLTLELESRGWDPIICNYGPALRDPKVEAARGRVRFHQFAGQESVTPNSLRSFLASLEPSVVIMGEGPFKAMEPLYYAAQSLSCPFVVLDQFYNPWLIPMKSGVDLVLMYSLGCFWRGEVKLKRPYELTPPFIDRVVAKEDLPLPPDILQQMWITLIAYDSYVLLNGLTTLSATQLGDLPIVVVCASPATCLVYAQRLGIDPARLTILPLQDDATVFGLLQASQVALLSNGFIQIMDCLALGTPVITLERGTGTGMTEMNIDRRFLPYVSLQEPVERQSARIVEWLRRDPFPPELREQLRLERNGIRHCADRVEYVATLKSRPATTASRAAHLARQTAGLIAYHTSRLLKRRSPA